MTVYRGDLAKQINKIAGQGKTIAKQMEGKKISRKRYHELGKKLYQLNVLYNKKMAEYELVGGSSSKDQSDQPDQ